MTDATKPLAGIRVIDLTTNMSGPMATMVLADQGADVVKVEALTGDPIRTVGSGVKGMSAYFANNNRAKRSIAVDLSTEQGRDLVRRLVAGADVFAQNFRPGVIERLGLGADALLRPIRGWSTRRSAASAQPVRSPTHRRTTTWCRRCPASSPSSRPAAGSRRWSATA